MTTRPDHWSHACAVALCGLPGMGPARLRALLLDMPADVAWSTIASGGVLPPEVLRLCGSNARKLITAWSRNARRTDPLETLEQYASRQIGIWTMASEYPDALIDDAWAPAVMFWSGLTRALDFPRVAIVGTRHASVDGRDVARQLGAELSEAGVSVVSGLALGIDGAAHTGALEASMGAPPIGVVGSGLDVVYPKRHDGLWRRMQERGLLLTEAPLKAKPEPWRFPARNRIIAALSDIVVVVESHERGGSLLTVEEADARGVTVMAVPGSLRNPAANGTNMLINAGCPIVRGVDDIMQLLPLEVLVRDDQPVTDLPEDPAAVRVLEALDWQPTNIDEVMRRTGMDPSELVAMLLRLEGERWVVGEGAWWRRSLPQGEGEVS